MYIGAYNLTRHDQEDSENKAITGLLRLLVGGPKMLLMFAVVYHEAKVRPGSRATQTGVITLIQNELFPALGARPIEEITLSG